MTLGLQANVAVIATLNAEIAKLERHLLQRLPSPFFRSLEMRTLFTQRAYEL